MMLPGLDNELYFDAVLRSTADEAKATIAANNLSTGVTRRRRSRPAGTVIRWIGAWRLGHRPLA